MGQGAGQEELVGFGEERARPVRPGAAGRFTRPWILAALVLAALVAGGAVWFVQERGAAPEPPTVAVADDQTAVDPTTTNVPFPWTAGENGRPAGPAVLRRELELTFSPSPELERIEIFGLRGPGLETAREPVRRLTGTTRVTTLPVEQELDCEQVDLPVPPDAYGISVRVLADARSSRATLEAGESGREWAAAVQSACASWLARTHVTVSEAVVAIDESRPRARLGLTLTNDGTRDAFVGTIGPDGGSDLVVTTAPAGAVRVPAEGSARLQVDLRIDACDTVSDIRTVGNGTDVPVAVTSDVIELYSTVGTESGLSTSAATWTTGLGPASIVLSGDAAREVSEGLRAACGGIEGFAVLVAPDGASYDPQRGVLSVKVLINGTPRTIRDLRLVGLDDDFGENAFRMITTDARRLVPDFTGQSATTLRYRVPRTGVCPSPNLFLPGFELVARTVPETGSRTVRFTHFAVQWDGQLVRGQICP